MIVYLLINIINARGYIGVSRLSLEQRWRKHVRQSHGNKIQYPLQRAIRKYGPDAFVRYVLYSGLSPKEAGGLEIKLIQHYGTQAPTGYNLTEGGDGIIQLSLRARKRLAESLQGHAVSLETRAKISASLTGRKGAYERTAQHRRKMSVATKGKKRSLNFRQRMAVIALQRPPHSEESRRKMSESRRGKPCPWARGRPRDAQGRFVAMK